MTAFGIQVPFVKALIHSDPLDFLGNESVTNPFVVKAFTARKIMSIYGMPIECIPCNINWLLMVRGMLKYGLFYN